MSDIAQQLRCVPDEAFTRLQYLQPQVGCGNFCSFCSQEAGRDLWQLTRDGLTSLLDGIHTVLTERRRTSTSRDLGLGSARRGHRQGVLFPYMDNDIFSYPYLDVFLSNLYDRFGATTRISTIGFNSRNATLSEMHNRICLELPHTIEAMRISVSEYAIGWRSRAGDAEVSQRYFDD